MTLSSLCYEQERVSLDKACIDCVAARQFLERGLVIVLKGVSCCNSYGDNSLLRIEYVANTTLPHRGWGIVPGEKRLSCLK